MKRRPKWSTVTIALAVIAALAIASPVFGIDRAIKKAIKKEVSKQISQATGPAGTNGANGAAGADGTARAYARVVPHAQDDCDAPVVGCTFNRSKGVTSVTQSSFGLYCVTATGISETTTPATVTADSGISGAFARTGGACGAGAFPVTTTRQPITTVCTNDACTTTTEVAGTEVLSDGVGFTIVIP